MSARFEVRNIRSTKLIRQYVASITSLEDAQEHADRVEAAEDGTYVRWSLDKGSV